MISGAAVFPGVALYVPGLPTANIDLLQIGASDFSLLRTRFILAGALAIILLTVFTMWLAALAVAIGAVLQAGSIRHTAQWGASGLTGATLTGALLIAGFVVTVAQLRSNSPFTLRTSAIAVIDGNLEWRVISGVVLPLLVLGIGRWACHHPGGNVPSGIERTATPIPLTFAFLLGLFLFVDPFAASILPAVPAKFGRAEPKPVTHFLKPTTNLLIGCRNATPGEASVRLIWEGEQGYLAQSLSGQDMTSIQITRNQVAAWAYPGVTTRQGLRIHVPVGRGLTASAPGRSRAIARSTAGGSR